MRSDSGDSPEPHEYRIAVIGGAVFLLVLAMFAAVLLFPTWARWMALRQSDRGALSEAQEWLRRAAWLPLGSAETELMRAVCHRRLGQMVRWEAALESAQAKGAPSRRLELEHTLGMIRMGAHEVPEEYWRNPVGVGLRPYDAMDVCVRGYLAQNKPEKAEQVLRFWSKELPEDAHVAYLQGVYSFNQGDEAKALVEFESALAREPEHELAHTGVARLFEKQDRLGEALTAYVRFASACPRSSIAVMGLAEVLRGLGHLEEARAIVERLEASDDPPSELAAEMGSIELESGNCQGALRWFGEAPSVSGDKKRELLRNAGTAFALLEEVDVADGLFEQGDAEEEVEFRASELLIQLDVSPGRREAADELDQLSVAATTVAPQNVLIDQGLSRVAERESADLTAQELYVLHCAACHGADGDGNGRGARHQFPWPRDLRTERFRLVSTDNANATIEDLKRVIKRGMPGTSMRAFDELSEDQLELLAEEVLRLRREGVREWYVALLQAEDEEVDEEDVREVVDLQTVPGEVIGVPSIGPADDAALRRGRKVYLDTGCRPCHGDHGSGPPDIPLFDEREQPTWPRDLANDLFKGGHEPESIWMRIVVGMPGSAHPAAEALKNEQYVDLVQYCVSLSLEPKRMLTNHERFLEATQSQNAQPKAPASAREPASSTGR